MPLVTSVVVVDWVVVVVDSSVVVVWATMVVVEVRLDVVAGLDAHPPATMLTTRRDAKSAASSIGGRVNDRSTIPPFPCTHARCYS